MRILNLALQATESQEQLGNLDVNSNDLEYLNKNLTILFSVRAMIRQIVGDYKAALIELS